MNQDQKDRIRAARLKRLREVRERRAAQSPTIHDNPPAFMSDKYVSLGDGNYRTTGGRGSY